MELIERHDYYQTSTHLIAAVYLKGYTGEGIKEQVEIRFDVGSVCYCVLAHECIADRKVEINVPDLTEPSGSKRKISFAPLYAEINPSESSYRILSTKVSYESQEVLGGKLMI